jgi:hypothetical protein
MRKLKKKTELLLGKDSVDVSFVWSVVVLE